MSWMKKTMVPHLHNSVSQTDLTFAKEKAALLLVCCFLTMSESSWRSGLPMWLANTAPCQMTSRRVAAKVKPGLTYLVHDKSV